MPNERLTFIKDPTLTTTDYYTYKCSDPAAAQNLLIAIDHPMGAHDQLIVSSKGATDSKS